MSRVNEEPRWQDTPLDVLRAVKRMKDWAAEHPEADTQGLTIEDWVELAAAALGPKDNT